MKFQTNAENFKRLTASPRPSEVDPYDDEDIVFEDGDYWIDFEPNTRTYVVFYTPGTNYSRTKQDLSYPFNAEGLTLAKERIKYLQQVRL